MVKRSIIVFLSSDNKEKVYIRSYRSDRGTKFYKVSHRVARKLYTFINNKLIMGIGSIKPNYAVLGWNYNMTYCRECDRQQ
jgi:NMD protein affecting ribosome stability and mRNA decay